MTQSKKRSLLLLFAVASMCLVLLTVSLSNLGLHPGNPMPVVAPQHAVPGNEPRFERVYSFNFLQAVLGLLLLLLMVYVPARMILFVKVRWLFRLLQMVAVLLIVVLLLSFLRFDPGCSTAECAQTGAIPASESPILSVESPPLQILGSIEIGLALAAILFSIWIFSRLFRHSPKDPVLLHAESAVQDMRSGKDFKSIIIQCYLRMADTLQREQGIQRDRNMTSREFEAMLVSRGIPSRPVHDLTHLFEKVRYGQDPLSREDELAAIHCLDAILGSAQGKSHG